MNTTISSFLDTKKEIIKCIEIDREESVRVRVECKNSKKSSLSCPTRILS